MMMLFFLIHFCCVDKMRRRTRSHPPYRSSPTADELSTDSSSYSSVVYVSLVRPSRCFIRDIVLTTLWITEGGQNSKEVLSTAKTRVAR